ncbi:hypothetical protein [Tenacibaculum sp. nBUS_03]
MGKELIKQVKNKLEDEREYDFKSEFWTSDIMAMFQEVVEATQEVIENTI